MSQATTPKIKCPHCKSSLLWSEDRGAHCDGCDDFNPETDLPLMPLLVACFTEPQLQIFRWNHHLARNQVMRIRTDMHVIGRRPDRPILLLPKW